MNDVIIIGGGPAGAAAAIYAARAKLDTLIIEKAYFGGQMAIANQMDNYPGIDTISGSQLGENMINQAIKFGAVTVKEEVVDLELDKAVKIVRTKERDYETRAVILCMGASPRKLGLPNEETLTGSGVSYCATCDGAFFKGMDVAVVGGGDTAAEDALYLSRFCNKVYLIHRRDILRASKTLSDQVLKNPKIIPVWDSVVGDIVGDMMVTGLKIKNVKNQEITDLKVNGIFIAIGNIPNTGLVRGKVELNDAGYIKTDDSMKTNVPGVFAAGDIREKTLRQVVTAASDGAVAGQSAEKYLTETNFM